MDAPKLGYQGHNLFIVSALPLGNDIYLCETKEGSTGKGKVIRMSVLRPHPHRGTQFGNGPPPDFTPQMFPDWLQFGVVKPTSVSHRKGQWKVTMWGYDDAKVHRYCEAHMPTDQLAVEFMVRNAQEFFK